MGPRSTNECHESELVSDRQSLSIKESKPSQRNQRWPWWLLLPIYLPLLEWVWGACPSGDLVILCNWTRVFATESPSERHNKVETIELIDLWADAINLKNFSAKAIITEYISEASLTQSLRLMTPACSSSKQGVGRSMTQWWSKTTSTCRYQLSDVQRWTVMF